MLTFVQISGRAAVVWTVVDKIDVVQTSLGLPLMLLAWSLTEIIRYSYYTLSLVRNLKLLSYEEFIRFITLKINDSVCLNRESLIRQLRYRFS